MIRLDRRIPVEIGIVEIGKGRLEVVGVWASENAPNVLREDLKLLVRPEVGNECQLSPEVGPEVREEVAFSRKETRLATCRWFSFSIPVKGRATLVWCGAGPFSGMTWRNVRYGRHASLSEGVRGSFFAKHGWLARLSGEALVIEPQTWSRLLVARVRYVLGVMSRPSVDVAKATALYLASRFERLRHRRPVWIVSDRVASADDNGRAFFEFCMTFPKSERTREIIFAVDRKSDDFRQLARLGRVVDITSFRYQALFLMAEFLISAQHGGKQRRPFSGPVMNLLKPVLSRSRFVYLKHGIFKDDMSDTVRRPALDARLVICAARGEYESIAHGNYLYPQRFLALCGQPRYDKLCDRSERAITIMPTWRRMYTRRRADGVLETLPTFPGSVFCRAFDALFKDERLKAACARTGYELRLMWHPNLQGATGHFHVGGYIRILPPTTRYADIFATSSLIVTDFSSTAFDIAYLKKPVVYFQPDEAEFFANQYDKGYFDYRRDGFGEVETDIAALVDRLIGYLESDCRMKPEYVRRVEGFFAYTDRGNCRRVYDAILKACEEDGEEG